MTSSSSISWAAQFFPSQPQHQSTRGKPSSSEPALAPLPTHLQGLSQSGRPAPRHSLGSMQMHVDLLVRTPTGVPGRFIVQEQWRQAPGGHRECSWGALSLQRGNVSQKYNLGNYSELHSFLKNDFTVYLLRWKLVVTLFCEFYAQLPCWKQVLFVLLTIKLFKQAAHAVLLMRNNLCKVQSFFVYYGNVQVILLD